MRELALKKKREERRKEDEIRVPPSSPSLSLSRNPIFAVGDGRIEERFQLSAFQAGIGSGFGRGGRVRAGAPRRLLVDAGVGL